MKVFYTILFISFTSIIFAQKSGDITKDTTLANEYYQQSLRLELFSQETIDLTKKAIELYERHELTNKIIEMKGWLAWNLIPKYGETAFEEANEAIALAKESLNDEKHILTSNAYLALGLYYSYSDVDKTFDYFYHLIKNPQTPDLTYFETLFHLTNIYRSTQEENKVEPFLNDFQERLKNTKPYLKKYEIKYHEIVGMIALSMSDEEKAIAYNREALRLNKIYQSPFDLTSLYADISKSYGKLEKADSAEINLQLFINRTDTSNYTPIKYSNFYGQIANAYQGIGNFQKSVDYYLQAKVILSNLGKEYTDLIIVNYNNLALSYKKLGQYEAAEKAAKETLKYDLSPILISNYLYSARYVDYAYDDALKYGQQGLEMCFEGFESNSVFDNPDKDTEVLYLIDAYLTLGYKAYFLHKKAATADNKLEWLQAAKESAELAIYFQKKMYLAYKGFNINIKCQLCGYEDDLVVYQATTCNITKKTEDLEQLFDYMEQFKGKLLLEYFTENPLPSALAETEYSITKDIAYYKQKIALATADSLTFFEKKLFDERQKMENFVQIVSEQHPEHANFFYNKNYTSVKTIQNTLAENAAFISYVITGDKLIAYVMTNDKQGSFEVNIDENFHTKVTKYAQLLENPLLVQNKKRNEFIQLSHQFYEQLLQPIEGYIKGKEHLIISPSNDLFHFPFETLLASKEEKAFHQLDFLVKQAEISYQYSATTYQRMQKQAKIKNQSFIGFAPVFENSLALNAPTRALSFVVDSVFRSLDNNELLSLPNTKVEVNTISKLLPSTVTNKVLLNQKATKKSILKAIKEEVQFLHIATHGLVNFENPNLSALACYDDNTYEGSFLFANEIQNSKIKADLVILSSCESGIGQQINGEGLIALNRSFIIGGANNVIFSLWKVSDNYSSQLMINFYKSYLDNSSYTAALRQAKLKMLENPTTANPRYWAAFVLIGE